MRDSTGTVQRYSLAAFGLAALVLAGRLGTQSAAQAPQYDLLIVNGRILDGSGGPWFQGSVAVKDGRIADIGRLPGATARQVIEREGPGGGAGLH